MTKKAKRRPVTPATLHRYVVWYCEETGLHPDSKSPENTIRYLLDRLADDAVRESNRRR